MGQPIARVYTFMTPKRDPVVTTGRDWKRYNPKDDRYDEVTAEIKKKLKGQQFGVGLLLQQASEERLFGPWGTFKDYVESELRINEKTAYRLIFASRMLELLKEKHCEILPVNERQVRPLSLLEEAHLRVVAWKRACTNKQKSSPSHIDVMREVNVLLDPKPDPTMDKNYREYREHFMKISAELVKASQMLEDGDLEKFLQCGDRKNRNRQRSLARLLSKLGIELADHYKHFTGFRPVSPATGE